MIDFLYILLAILCFGLLVTVHEFGHFIAAKLFRVRVNEFAIGMGPALLKKKKGDTQYSLRLFPIGGFCALEGEEENSDNEGALTNKPLWKKLIIFVAGSVMNFLAGLVIIILIYAPAGAFYTNEITGFADGFVQPSSHALMAGDRIEKINGHDIYLYSDISFFLTHDAGQPYDIVVRRGGERVTLTGVELTKQVYTEGDTARYGIAFGVEESNPLVVLRVSALQSADFVRMVVVSLGDLFGGTASVGDLTGPIGLTGTITETAKRSLSDMWFLVAFIAINLAFVNMLPIPALDGGKCLFLLVDAVVRRVRGKPINPKYEGYVHLVGFALLIILMVYVGFNDIMRLVSG